ncbi:TIGR03619 family F420-dependent LLM class oxidoreductase [Acidocella sp.]|uniref:TIGR03619 family F420-dependent LLM class oxidoreductase n=1 Tax=Acidocella sp. TaxID=50710 RepID=UPI00263A2CEA|nr:TIGR03619 family F420-dependent LLM class oxidoreductase [Acidocella sp.]
MKLNVPLPFDQIEPADEFTTMAAVREVGQVIEKAGFNAGLVTDHPCPTGRWLDSGGHYAQGPFVMLSLLGAVTTKLRLQTGILVLPYRNPFTVARDVATLDRFSNGRVTVSVGVGYLKGEYKALGVDFEQRADLMDEYLRAMRLALTGQEFTFEGTGYTALGNRIQPGPVQQPVPLYVGGNAKRAIRRAVELADAWNPFFTAPGIDTTSRTATMTGVDDLAAGITYMREYCESFGREKMPEVVLGSIFAPGETRSTQKYFDRIGQYQELGVSAAGVLIEGRTRAEWCDNAQRLGEDVISKL